MKTHNIIWDILAAIVLLILIGMTVICIVFGQYKGLFGIGLCWLLAIAGVIRGFREESQ